MVSVTFVSASGETTTVEVQAGTTLMQAAVWNGVDGILGDCGGSCSCATCHVFIDEPEAGRIAPITAAEEALLAFREDRKETSRLGCQVVLPGDLETLVVHLPESQY